ncbi:MAG: DUF3667 domain-containing protein [Bacteroidales bacterium]|nr:DUF3667 domain-containing protein [Bacteroidales bacterium]
MFCENCENIAKDSYKYCPECGQMFIEKLTVKDLLNNFVYNYFSVDSRFFKSFIPLLFKPGNLPEVFVKGKRMKYLHPIQFYLFISLIFFFLLSISTKNQRENFNQFLEKGFANSKISNTADPDNTDMKKGPKIVYSFDNAKLDSLISINASKEEKIMVIGYKKGDHRFKSYLYSQILKIYEKSGKQILDIFYDIIPVALFFFLPLFSVILKLLFYKEINYSYHLVFSFYFFTFFFLVFCIHIILSKFFSIPLWILLFLSSVYLFFGIKKFYKKKIITTLVKTLSIMVINLFMLIPFSLLLLYITVLLY